MRVLLLMTLSILIFRFYPVTAKLWSWRIALLNDGAILVHRLRQCSLQEPNLRAWNMRLILGISTVLGVIGVVYAFGLFYMGVRVFQLDREHIQTLI